MDSETGPLAALLTPASSELGEGGSVGTLNHSTSLKWPLVSPARFAHEPVGEVCLKLSSGRATSPTARVASMAHEFRRGTRKG